LEYNSENNPQGSQYRSACARNVFSDLCNAVNVLGTQFLKNKPPSGVYLAARNRPNVVAPIYMAICIVSLSH
jgi:hypothetical protein